MYTIQKTWKGSFIVRNPGGREMFKGGEAEAQAWIDRKQAELQQQGERVADQEAFDNTLPDLNALQIRWQKWRNWFYDNLQSEGRRQDQMRGALDRTDSSLRSYNHHEAHLTRDQEQQASAQALYERAVSLDTRIKNARQKQDISALRLFLAETEGIISQMDDYFVSRARPE